MKYCKKCNAERTGNFCSVCGSGLVEAKIEICCPKCGITYKAGSYCLEDGTKLVRKVVLPTDEVEPVAVRPVSSIVSTSPKESVTSNQNKVRQTAQKTVNTPSKQQPSNSNSDKWPLWKWIIALIAVLAIVWISTVLEESAGMNRMGTTRSLLRALQNIL